MIKSRWDYQNNSDKCQSSELPGWSFSRRSKKGQVLIKVWFVVSMSDSSSLSTLYLEMINGITASTQPFLHNFPASLQANILWQLFHHNSSVRIQYWQEPGKQHMRSSVLFNEVIKSCGIDTCERRCWSEHEAAFHNDKMSVIPWSSQKKWDLRQEQMETEGKGWTRELSCLAWQVRCSEQHRSSNFQKSDFFFFFFFMWHLIHLLNWLIYHRIDFKTTFKLFFFFPETCIFSLLICLMEAGF